MPESAGQPDNSHCNRIHPSLTAVHCFYNDYVGKQPVAWREYCVDYWFNPFPNDKVLDTTELKAFADDNLNIAKMMISLLDRVENTMDKGENAGYQHFLLFPQCFPNPSSLMVVKSRDCVVKS